MNANDLFFKDFDIKDQQIVAKYLKTNSQIDTSALPALNRILMDVQGEVSTLFYKETFEIDDNQNYKFALQYLIDEGSSEYYNFLKKEITNSSNGHQYMLDILEFSFYYYLNGYSDSSKKNTGIKIIKLYFDNEEICESLKKIQFPETRKNQFSSMSNILVRTNYENNPDIKNMCYYKLFLESKLTEPVTFVKV